MSQVTIIQGEDREVFIGVKDTDEDVFIDLTGVTEITAKIAATAGGSVDFTLSTVEITVTDATKGKFKINMSDTKTALAKLGDNTLEVFVDFGAHPGGNRRIIQQEKAFLVKKKVY